MNNSVLLLVAQKVHHLVLDSGQQRVEWKGNPMVRHLVNWKVLSMAHYSVNWTVVMLVSGKVLR